MATVADLEKRIDRHDEDIADLKKNLDEYKLENVKQLTKLETKLDAQKETMTEIRDKVKELAEKPGKRWDGLTMTIMTFFVSTVLGFLAAHILK